MSRQTVFINSVLELVKNNSLIPSFFLSLEGLFSNKDLVAPEPRRPQRFAHPPLAEHMLLTSGVTQHDTPRKIVGSRVRREIPAVEESKMYQKQKLIMDAGCFMGRSFRVGWGPGWTLVHSGLSANTQQKG